MAKLKFPPLQATSDKEVVLPSGRFARVRPVLWGDLALVAGPSPQVMAAKLVARVCTLDGAKVSESEVYGMPVSEFFPIMRLVDEFVVAAQLLQNGVA